MTDMKKNQLETLEMKNVTVKIKKPKDARSIKKDMAEKQISELESKPRGCPEHSTTE